MGFSTPSVFPEETSRHLLVIAPHTLKLIPRKSEINYPIWERAVFLPNSFRRNISVGGFLMKLHWRALTAESIRLSDRDKAGAAMLVFTKIEHLAGSDTFY